MKFNDVLELSLISRKPRFSTRVRQPLLCFAVVRVAQPSQISSYAGAEVLAGAAAPRRRLAIVIFGPSFRSPWHPLPLRLGSASPTRPHPKKNPPKRV
jgi:hypothetical protein